jgi:hypothetical protein
MQHACRSHAIPQMLSMLMSITYALYLSVSKCETRARHDGKWLLASAIRTAGIMHNVTLLSVSSVVIQKVQETNSAEFTVLLSVLPDVQSACLPADRLVCADCDVEQPVGGESDSDSEAMEFWDLGTVTDVYDGTGTHGVLRIQFSSGLILKPDGTLQRMSRRVNGTKESGLLPFARDIVPEIDIEEGVIIVDPPIGWLEMFLTPSEKKRKKRFRKPKSPKPAAVPAVERKEPVA